MSRKKSSNHNFKKLGSLQERILFFLAENPDKHTKAIQQELEYPDIQYPNVLKDVKALEKFGFIKSRKGKSIKKVTIRFYNCTEEGVFYTLARNPNVNVLSVLDSYKNRYDLYKSFRNLIDIWGSDVFVRFIRDVNGLLPMIQKDGLQKALPFLFMKIAMEVQSVDPTVRKKIARETMKQFPHTKSMLKEWAKSMNELVGE